MIGVASAAPAAELAAVGVVVSAQIAVLIVENPSVSDEAAKVALTAAGEVSWLDTAPHLVAPAATAVESPETALAAAVVAAAVEVVTAAAVCGPSVAATPLLIDLIASAASGAAASIA